MRSVVGLAAGLLLPRPGRAARAAVAWQGVIREPGAARAIGRAYLAEEPGEADRAVLVAALSPVCPSGRVADLSVGELRARMQRARCDDFEAGRIVSLRGWILARSEAGLGALAALDG